MENKNQPILDQIYEMKRKADLNLTEDLTDQRNQFFYDLSMAYRFYQGGINKSQAELFHTAATAALASEDDEPGAPVFINNEEYEFSRNLLDEIDTFIHK